MSPDWSAGRAARAAQEAIARARGSIRGLAPFVGSCGARKLQPFRLARNVSSTCLEQPTHWRATARIAPKTMKTPQAHSHPDLQRNAPRNAAPTSKEKTEGIPWTPLPTEPQVRRRSTDALPWRPTQRMRWER
jgi:hypothetical protein